MKGHTYSKRRPFHSVNSAHDFFALYGAQAACQCGVGDFYSGTNSRALNRAHANQRRAKGLSSLALPLGGRSGLAP